jgi:hypothetical protein
MELSPKGQVFGGGGSRKRTVQEATPYSMRGFYNSSDSSREKRSETGAREARAFVGDSERKPKRLLSADHAPRLPFLQEHSR